jgi:hypothetical protein
MFVYDRFVTTAGPLIAEYARQAAVEPTRLAGELPRILTADGTLPAPSAAARDTWDAERGTADRATTDDLLARARDDRGMPWPQPRASAAARVHRDGDRDEWEQAAFARQRRLSRAAVAAAVTLDDAWLDEVADGVWLLCEQSSWCWPAHDDSRRRHGSVLPVVTDPFLDLGAGEVAGQLAWIDHLLGGQLEVRYPGLRHRMAHETRARVLDPFRIRRDWHWLGLDGDVHNWNPWIHGNVLVAALRFLEPAERPATIALVVEGLDRYVAALPDDGAIDEGYGYWWNGACRALEALDVLRHATGGRLDATAVPALRATVAFPHRMQLGGRWFVDFADSQARPSAEQPWHALHRAAIQAGDDEARAFAASQRRPGAPAATEREGLGRLLRGMTDPAWLDAAPGTAPLPRDVWLPSTQVRIVRHRAGATEGLALAIKGGHNGEHHNHNDVGSIIVASNGIPVVADAGRPTYTAATFGPERYAIWTMQGSWHSVPDIRGTAQGTGPEFAASAVAVIDDGTTVGLDLDLAGSYPVPGLRKWRRIATLDRAAGRVVVDDAWQLDPWDGPDSEPRTTVRLLLAGAVELAPGEARVTSLDRADPVVVRWDADATATLVVRPLDDPMLREVWGERLSRLDIDVTTRAQLRVTVELDPPIREMLE